MIYTNPPLCMLYCMLRLLASKTPLLLLLNPPQGPAAEEIAGGGDGSQHLAPLQDIAGDRKELLASDENTKTMIRKREGG